MEAEIQQPWLFMNYNAHLARRRCGVPNPLFQKAYSIVYWFPTVPENTIVAVRGIPVYLSRQIPSGRVFCDSQFTILSLLSFDGPQLWRSMSVCSSLYLLTPAHCAQCFASIPLWLASQILPAGARTQSPDCALRIPVSHDRRRVWLCFLLVHQAFWAWFRSRFQELIRGYPPQSQSAQIPTSEQLLWAHRWCLCAAHLLLLLCAVERLVGASPFFLLLDTSLVETLLILPCIMP